MNVFGGGDGRGSAISVDRLGRYEREHTAAVVPPCGMSPSAFRGRRDELISTEKQK